MIHQHQTTEESHDLHKKPNQQALTEGLLGGELERPPTFLEQSCPLLEANADKNLSLHFPLSTTEGVEKERESPFPQA